MRNFCLSILFSVFSAIAVNADTVDVFIMAGQSNMQGWMGDAAHYPSDTGSVDSRILFWWEAPGFGSSQGKWIRMSPQTGRFPKGHFGPEVTFARELAENGYNPAIFKFSLGATGLAKDWRGPGEGGLYDRMAAEYAKAIAILRSQGHDVKPRVFVWIQGESDAETQALADGYYRRLCTLIENVRGTMTGVWSLPVILGVDEQHPWVLKQPSVVEAQKKCAAADSLVVWTSMMGLPKADATHLTPAGLEAHGTRLFDAYTSLTSYRWTEVTGQAAFAPRDGAGILVFNGKIWLLGGWNPTDKTNFPLICNNEVWSSKDGASWELEKPNTFLSTDFDPQKDWEGRHTAGYAVLNKRMWIVGGDANQKHYQNDVWSSADGKNWQCVTRNIPWGPRVLHYTVAFKGHLWVMGGQTLPQFAPEKARFYDDVWSSADGVVWEKADVQRPAWPPRGMIGGCAVFNDRIWILGGGTYDTPEFPERKFYNDVWSSPDGIHWERHVEHAPWHPRQYHDVAVYDGKLWVLEGWNNGNRSDVWYSADGTDWHELTGVPWKPRHAASVCVFDNALWVVAGNNMESDAWRLQRKAQVK